MKPASLSNLSPKVYNGVVAKVLLFLQLIIALVVLPLWPGLSPQYTFLGLIFLAVVVTIPLATVLAVVGAKALLVAWKDVWAPNPVRSPESLAVWALFVKSYPAAGILGGLTALVGALNGLDPIQPALPQAFVLAFFCLVWGFLGVLLARTVHQILLRVASPVARALMILTPEIGHRFGLTPREIEASQAILDGLTYQGAAQRMAVSVATVKSHVLSSYQKTGAGNKIELLRLVEAETGRLHHSVDGALAQGRSSWKQEESS